MLQLKPKRAESIPTVHAAHKRCDTGLTAGIPAPKLILGCIVVHSELGKEVMEELGTAPILGIAPGMGTLNQEKRRHRQDNRIFLKYCGKGSQ